MYIPLKIASKYIFSKKNKTFINFLSIFSIASLAVGTAAMIIILSVFNGLEESLKSIYRDFDPDLKIISSDGSYIRNELANEIYTINNVDVITPFIENKSLLQNNGKEVVSFIKGVDKTFINQGRVVNNLTEGEFNLFNQKSKNVRFEPWDPQKPKFAKRRSFSTPRDPGNPPKSSVSTRSTSGDVMVFIPSRRGGRFFCSSIFGKA